jgi:hypothetical protein
MTDKPAKHGGAGPIGAGPAEDRVHPLEGAGHGRPDKPKTTRQERLAKERAVREERRRGLMAAERARKDRERLDIVVQASNRVIPQATAAAALGIKERQLRKLITDYRREGPPALLHKARGKPSNNSKPSELYERAIEFAANKCPDCGPTLTAHVLQEDMGIEVNPETLRRWMAEANLWTIHDPGGPRHRARERRPRLGELVQMDTSVHHWFGEDRPLSHVIAMIDDATSRLHCRFYEEDSTWSNMDAIRRYVNLHGRPLSLYTDKASHFKVNKSTKDADLYRIRDHEPITQLHRALDELGIELIFAHSPQAKGRVERLFGTLQDRLLKLFAFHGVTDIEAANDYATRRFIPWWNKTLAKAPLAPADLHRSTDGFDLDAVFSKHHLRTVTNDYTFQYGNSQYQIESRDIDAKMRRKKILIEERPNGDFKAEFNGKYVHYRFYRTIKM